MTAYMTLVELCGRARPELGASVGWAGRCLLSSWRRGRVAL
jgi:hypothetical protein